MAKSKQLVVVRVLLATVIDEVQYQPNDIVEMDAQQAKPLVEKGIVDDTPEAVDYCKKELGCECISHAERCREKKSVATQTASDDDDGEVIE